MCHYLTAYTISKFLIETEAFSATETGFTHNFILNMPNVDHIFWDESVILCSSFLRIRIDNQTCNKGR